jgi:tRNA (Thr-GGU) A37 N-methylase
MIVGLRAMAGKNVKLKEVDISEILVADTDLESGAEASDVEDYFEEEEEEEEQQQQQALAEIAVTNTGQRNHQPNCAAICVLAARERAHSAPHVTWACAWCLVSWNSTQK